MVLSCGHRFCMKCVSAASYFCQTSCPVCRKEQILDLETIKVCALGRARASSCAAGCAKRCAGMSPLTIGVGVMSPQLRMGRPRGLYGRLHVMSQQSRGGGEDAAAVWQLRCGG